jgi:two-component system nitrogen regulation sensor histidine kinase NtrY
VPETHPTSEEPPGRPVRPRRGAFSIAGRVAGILAAGLALFAALTWAGLRFELPLRAVVLASFALVLPAVTWAAGRFLRPLRRTLEALSDGIRSFRDRDFSVRIATKRTDELGELVRLYNLVGEILQEERGRIRQRELLLQAALDQSPIAIVLVNPLDRILYANAEARRLFLGGGRLVGWRFGDVLAQCPAELRQTAGEARDGIFTVEGDDQPETYHLAERGFYLNRQRHRLFLLRRITAELARQEAEIWKKVIRIISHELNNSLAPISSLAHSGLLIAKKPDQVHRLEEIHTSIRERIDHLTQFLEGYARFARLPKPKRVEVDWADWLAAPREMYDFETIGKVPEAHGFFDPSQLQQALINLLKNAAEASDGKPEIAVRIDPLQDGRVRVQVLDRGRGMSEEVMRKALLPFYSTKPSGSGVGLPLCREIVEAHGGSMRIQSRDGGGTIVSFWLPPGPGRE